jgi:acetoin utilization protein AcuC
MDLSRALGWLPAAQFVASPRARPLALQQFHTPDYISALARAEARQSVSDADRARYHLGTPSNPVFAQMFRRPATSAGGVILAGELLAKGGAVYVPGGGTHHGMPDRANGFCYLNDPVLAIKSLQHHGAPRVLYVDVDAHHPDGVEVAFSGDTAVRMISVHEQGRWPRTGALDERAGGSAFNLPVPQELNDSEMAVILDEMILPLAEDFAPDAVVLQCGADALDEDPQSRLSLSNGALWSVVAALRAIIHGASGAVGQGFGAC